jgi:hypothetical protein
VDASLPHAALVPNGAGVAVVMLLVWLAGYTAAIMAGLGLNYPRYFLPSALLLLPFMGAGAALLVEGARHLGRVRGSRPVLEHAPAPPAAHPSAPESA